MSDAQTDRELIIRGCEYWVKNHKDESLPLAYSSVVELMALLKEQEGIIKTLEDKDTKLMLLVKEQRETGEYVPCKIKSKIGTWDGEKCSVCGSQYIGSAPRQWKYCPHCGAKMEGL